jgi:hypothetical protein
MNFCSAPGLPTSMLMIRIAAASMATVETAVVCTVLECTVTVSAISVCMVSFWTSVDRIVTEDDAFSHMHPNKGTSEVSAPIRLHNVQGRGDRKQV